MQKVVIFIHNSLLVPQLYNVHAVRQARTGLIPDMSAAAAAYGTLH